MSVGAGRPLCLFSFRQQGKSGLVFSFGFVLRLYLGKEGDTGVVGHVWNYSGWDKRYFLKQTSDTVNNSVNLSWKKSPGKSEPANSTE